MVIVHLDTYDSILLKSNDKSFHALYYIIKQMDLSTNVWYADKTNKTDICAKLAITSPTLEKMLASLRERELILSVQRGKYSLSETVLYSY